MIQSCEQRGYVSFEIVFREVKNPELFQLIVFRRYRSHQFLSAQAEHLQKFEFTILLRQSERKIPVVDGVYPVLNGKLTKMSESVNPGGQMPLKIVVNKTYACDMTRPFACRAAQAYPIARLIFFEPSTVVEPEGSTCASIEALKRTVLL